MGTEWVRCTSSYVLSLRANGGAWMCLGGDARSDVLTGRDARRWRWLSTCSVTATLQCPPGCCCLAPKSCPALCSPMDCSPPGSSVHGIFPAGILEWVAIFSSRASSWPRDWTSSSCVFLHWTRILHHWATREALLHILQRAWSCSTADPIDISGWWFSAASGWHSCAS